MRYGVKRISTTDPKMQPHIGQWVNNEIIDDLNEAFRRRETHERCAPHVEYRVEERP